MKTLVSSTDSSAAGITHNDKLRKQHTLKQKQPADIQQHLTDPVASAAGQQTRSNVSKQPVTTFCRSHQTYLIIREVIHQHYSGVEHMTSLVSSTADMQTQCQVSHNDTLKQK